MYKIKVARSVYSVRDEDHSESVRRQAIYRARFDRDATVGTLVDTLIIFLRFMYFTLYTYFLVLHFAFIYIYIYIYIYCTHVIFSLLIKIQNIVYVYHKCISFDYSVTLHRIFF